MSPAAGRLLLGAGAAAAVALVLSDARLFGIEAWKILLALGGLALFMRARHA